MSKSSPNYANYTSTDTYAPTANGLVNILPNAGAAPNIFIPSYFTTPPDNTNYVSEAISHDIERSCLSDLYFSALNIDAVQEGLRYLVYKQTSSVIGRQSDQELKLIMRGIFLQYAKHEQYDVVGQVKELNQRVLEFAVPRVVTNLRQHQKYIVDASTMPVPLDRAPIATMKGSRSLEYKVGL